MSGDDTVSGMSGDDIGSMAEEEEKDISFEEMAAVKVTGFPTCWEDFLHYWEDFLYCREDVVYNPEDFLYYWGECLHRWEDFR